MTSKEDWTNQFSQVTEFLSFMLLFYAVNGIYSYFVIIKSVALLVYL